MREQLTKYVELLFAGAPDAEDIKQEILINTLERYDDLVAQGKTPQAAYQLAISGIGDINEILGCAATAAQAPHAAVQKAEKPAPAEKPFWKKLLRAIGIFLYIICAIPLLVLAELGMDVIGLCGTLSIAAVATVLMILSSGSRSTKDTEQTDNERPESELTKAINSIIFAVGLCGYLALSFATGAWYITWVIFLIIAAVQGLVKACCDLKEANKYEK